MRVFIVFGIVFVFMLITILLQPHNGRQIRLRPEPPAPATVVIQTGPPAPLVLTHHLPRS